MMQPAADSSLYRAVINVPAAGPDPDGGFKIADSDWTPGTNCGSSTGLTIGQPLTLACTGPGNDNIAVNWPQTGTYFFALDTTNPAAPVLTVEKTPFDRDLYVRGVGDDWSASDGNRMTYVGNGLYRLRRAAAAGPDDAGFKIADLDWTSGTDCGSSTGLTIGQPLTLACTQPGNDNINVSWPATGIYNFSLDATNATTPQLTVTGP
jgi:hypothetical protein